MGRWPCAHRSRELVPGHKLVGILLYAVILFVAMSTENLVSNENLRVLTSVLENADLPLTEEKVDEIERSLER